MQSAKGVWRRLFNDNVYKEFRICFTIAKYENDVFSLCETSNAFIHVFFLPFRNPFSSVRIVKIDFNNAEIFHVLLGLSPVWNRYPKGSHTTGPATCTKGSIIAYDEIEDRLCKEVSECHLVY